MDGRISIKSVIQAHSAERLGSGPRLPVPSRQGQQVRVLDHASVMIKGGSIGDKNVIHAQAAATQYVTMETLALADDLEFARNNVCAACLVKAAIEGVVQEDVRGRQKSSI